jgi:hypothetical protein
MDFQIERHTDLLVAVVSGPLRCADIGPFVAALGAQFSGAVGAVVDVKSAVPALSLAEWRALSSAAPSPHLPAKAPIAIVVPECFLAYGDEYSLRLAYAGRLRCFFSERHDGVAWVRWQVVRARLIPPASQRCV